MLVKNILACLCLFLLLATSVYGNEAIVNPKQVYTYEQLQIDLSRLQARYSEVLTLKKIGTSFLGRDLLAVKLGKGKQHILIVGAHHGREWMTTALMMKMLETYSEAYIEKKPLGPYSAEVFDDVSIWFVPMINPDGVSIQQNNLAKFNPLMRQHLLILNKGSSDFSRWKANAQGIDLNRQYPAGWDELPKDPAHPSYQFYKGTRPLETKEVQALIGFTYELNPLAAVAYHSSGREIYWNYKNKYEKRDRHLAWKLSRLTGYELSVPPPRAVGGGYTDWFITEFDKPGFTIEICPYVKETSPPLSVFDEEWERNYLVGVFLAKEAKKLKPRKNSALEEFS